MTTFTVIAVLVAYLVGLAAGVAAFWLGLRHGAALAWRQGNKMDPDYKRPEIKPIEEPAEPAIRFPLGGFRRTPPLTFGPEHRE